MQKLFTVTYGSKLYGTSSPTSDTDLKTIYLPSLDELMLCKKAGIFKIRLDASGGQVPSKDPMPENGVEEEFFPFQTFARGFLGGQTYALEVAHAVNQRQQVEFFGDVGTQNLMKEFIKTLISEFTTNNVSSMVGFAKKQTYDYVYRGERLAFARRLLSLLESQRNQRSLGDVPSDVRYPTVLDFLSAESGLPLGTVENNNRVLRAIDLNGRLYSETTSVEHLYGVVKKMIDKYGTRSQQASLTDVEYKSMVHAVRIYDQSLELLETGKISFPRPNADLLLEIKNGNYTLAMLTEMLKRADAEIGSKLKETKFMPLTAQYEHAIDELVLSVVKQLYLNSAV